MTPSVEYRALLAIRQPKASSQGDMWLCRRLGIVKVFNGHSRNTRRGRACNNFHLYHWGRPSLRNVGPCDWRDDDPASSADDPALGRLAGEVWEYVGNIFDMLPFDALAARGQTENIALHGQEGKDGRDHRD